MKKCTICGVEKPLDMFNFRKGAKDGRRADCMDCKRSRDAAYRELNKEKINEQIREWYEKNRDATLAQRRQRYDREKEKILQNNREWRQSNPDKKRACGWHRKARVRNAEGRFTKDDIEKLKRYQRMRCAMCGSSIKNGFHIDHIMPLSLGGTNWPSNLQLLCPRCNLSKGQKHPIDFANKLGMLL